MLPGVRSRTVTTDRLRVQFIESGPEDGIPVLLIHGNLSTGRFYEHLLPGMPERYRHLAGWSTGGGAIAAYAADRPAASLTFIDPVSPYGFGGVLPDGRPCFDDYA